MPSILNTKARRVLRYLNKYGISNIKLTIYIMDIESSLDQVVALEQHFIDTLKPNLNVDLFAASSGRIFFLFPFPFLLYTQFIDNATSISTSKKGVVNGTYWG